MEKADYIIDVQAFHDKEGGFLPKEIAVLGTDRNYASHWIVKPPYDVTELSKGILATNSYLTCYHHGIEWFDGESNLEDVYSALREVARNAVHIYVRGQQKQDLLQRLLGRQIINLEEYDCPSFKNLPRVNEHYCFHHGIKREYFSCAVGYAHKLRDWLIRSLAFTTPPTKDEIDSQQKKKKENNKENSKESAVNKCRRSSSRTPTTTVPALTPPPRSGDAEPLYENVTQNELSADSTSTCARGGPNSGGVPRRQDTETLAEAVCPCS